MAMKFLNSDDPTAALVKRVQSLTEQITMLELDANRLDREVGEALAAAGHAALDVENGKISRKEYDTLARKAVELEGEKKQKLYAAQAARGSMAQLKQELFEAKSGDRKREAEVFGNAREKCATEMADAIVAFWKARQRLHTVNEKIAQAFGASVTLQHGGTLISANEIQRALEIELARVSYAGPMPGNVCPALPGTKALTGNPAKLPPLVETIKQANALLVTHAVTGYAEAAPKPAKSKAVSAAVEPDPDAAILETSGSVVSAEQVLATLGRRQLS
jgi:hypothetical protein